MSQVVERSKNRLLVTVVLLAVAGGLMAVGVFLLMPPVVLESVYDFFGGKVSDTCPWEKNPFLLYMARVMALLHAWLAATFVLVMLDPLKYRTLYWLNMLAMLALGVAALVAGFAVGMPAVAALLDAGLCLAAAVGLWLARPKTNV